MTGPLAPRWDDTPVTWMVLIVYVTMGFLTDPFSPTLPSLVEHGAAVGMLIPDEPWRLLTYGFLHGGILHLGFNSYFLVWLGPQLERSLGSRSFALLYAVGALGGGLGGTLWSGSAVPLVGGSGALFAMMGAAIALMMRRGRTQLEFLASHGARNFLMLIGANLVLGWLLPMVSNSAHVGGLIAGFVLVYMFLERGRAPTDLATRVAQSGWIGLVMAVVLWTCFPVTRWDWNLRQSFLADTPDMRAAHEAALLRSGIPNEQFQRATGRRFIVDRGPIVYVRPDDLEELLRDHLPQVWGDSGRRLIDRWFE